LRERLHREPDREPDQPRPRPQDPLLPAGGLFIDRLRGAEARALAARDGQRGGAGHSGRRRRRRDRGAARARARRFPRRGPIAPTISDTFTGSLTPLAVNSHPFVVNVVGGLKVTLTSVDPLLSLTIGVGTPSTTTGTCVVVRSVTTDPGTSPQLSGTASIQGNFCVAVSDPGNVTDT